MKPASDLDRGHDGRRYILFVHQLDSRSDRTMAQLGVGQRVRSKRSASSPLGLRPSPGVDLPEHFLSIRITLDPPNVVQHSSLGVFPAMPGARPCRTASPHQIGGPEVPPHRSCATPHPPGTAKYDATSSNVNTSGVSTIPFGGAFGDAAEFSGLGFVRGMDSSLSVPRVFTAHPIVSIKKN